MAQTEPPSLPQPTAWRMRSVFELTPAPLCGQGRGSVARHRVCAAPSSSVTPTPQAPSFRKQWAWAPRPRQVTSSVGYTVGVSEPPQASVLPSGG